MNVLNLFKYYAPEYDSKPNISFYTKRQLYFQQPIKFNDPWDCKSPPITISRQSNALHHLWMNLKTNNPQTFNDANWEKFKELNRSEQKLHFSTLYQTAFDKQRSKLGVFSLSFIPDSELMWSHYARSHSGYMLHFQINLDEYINNGGMEETGIPIPVIYKKTREPLNLVNYYKDRERHMHDLVRYKSQAWEYEYELRILSVQSHGFLNTPKGWLKSIITGINIENKLQEKLMQIGKELKVSVYSAKMSPDRFKVIIPDFMIDMYAGKKQYQDLLESKVLDITSSK